MADDSRSLENRVYTEILGLSPDNCPPNYFVLLGIPKSTDVAEEVDAAAKRQTERIRRGVPPELHSAALHLLKRIARARICLSDPAARSAYLASLEKSGGTASRGNLPSEGNPGEPIKGAPPNVKPDSGASTRQFSGDSSALGAVKRPAAALPSLDSLDLPLLLSDSSLSEIEDHSVSPLSLPPVRRKKKQNDQLAVYLSVAAIVGVGALFIGVVMWLASRDPDALPSSKNQLADAGVKAQVNPAASSATGQQGSGVPSAGIVTKETARNTLGRKRRSAEPGVDVIGRGEAKPQEDSLPVSVVPETVPVDESSPLPIAAVTAAPINQAPTFENLVGEILLPPLRAQSTNAAESNLPSTADLGSINDSTWGQLEVAINQPKVKVKAAATTEFYATKEEEGKTHKWAIRLRAATKPSSETPAPNQASAEISQLDAASMGFHEAVAQLYVEEGQLRFGWLRPEHTSLAEQLRNCVLQLRAAQLQHDLQLRPVQETYKFGLDLSKRNQLFTVEDEHLPASDGMIFQVHDLQLAGVKFELDPVEGVVREGGMLRVKLENDTGPTELQFNFSVTSKRATIRFTPRYRLGSRWYYFTGDDVHGSLEDLRAALDDSHASMNAAESAARSLPGRIDAARARLKADDINYARVQGEILQMSRQLRAARGAVRRASNAIPEIEAKIPQLERFVALGRQLHQKGQIKFRIFVPLEEGELELLKTGDKLPPEPDVVAEQ
jgi:hypothetical protein